MSNEFYGMSNQDLIDEIAETLDAMTRYPAISDEKIMNRQQKYLKNIEKEQKRRGDKAEQRANLSLMFEKNRQWFELGYAKHTGAPSENYIVAISDNDEVSQQFFIIQHIDTGSKRVIATSHISERNFLNLVIEGLKEKLGRYNL